MQLSLHADYACRVLMFLATCQEGKASIPAIAESFAISENHLVKVVHRLGQLGFLVTTRGRGGGIRLARDPQEIRIGDVVRQMEPSLALVECFDAATNSCPLVRICSLKHALGKAMDAFLTTLDGVTLAEVTANRLPLAKAMNPSRSLPRGR